MDLISLFDAVFNMYLFICIDLDFLVKFFSQKSFRVTAMDVTVRIKKETKQNDGLFAAICY